MARIIRKKTWPKFFELMRTGEKGSDLRLRDFPINKGDIIVFEEWNPDTKSYTGRSFSRTVINVNHVHPFAFWSSDELERKGLWLIETKKMSRT